MLNKSNILFKRTAIFLILAGLFVVAGLVINNGTDEFVVPIAIGDTNTDYTASEDFQHLERANRAFINLVSKTKNSVVQINTRVRIRRDESSRLDRDESRRRLLEEWFGFRFPDDMPAPEVPTPRRSQGVGSGVIVSEDGYILTNNHVIDSANEIKVTLPNGREYEAELIGQDPGNPGVSGTDLAVLKIDAEGLPALPFGDSDALEVGEWVIAIGTPLNLSQTVTRGIVSAKNRRRFTNIQYGNFIQTDAPINRGNSGGALINIRGELVGINTLIATGGFTTGNIGIGFAIPSNTANALLPQLIENGEIVRGWLGISMDPVSHELAEKLNLDSTQGVLVLAVGPDSPAEKGGIRHGDVIVEFNGKPVQGESDLMFTVAETAVGTSVEIKVVRNKKEKVVKVKLEKRTEEAVASLRSPVESEPQLIEPEELPETEPFAGMQTQKLTPELARRYGYNNEKGVIVVQVEEDSPAADNGIQVGYLIKEIDYITIEDLADYKKVVKELEKKGEELALVYVKSPNGRVNYLTLKIDSNGTEDNR